MIPDRFTHLLTAPATATLVTIGPDGAPHTAPVWFHWDGTQVLLSTVAGTQKHRNVERDPRVSFTIVDPANPMSYLELRGTVTIQPDPAKRLPDTIVVKHGYPDAKAFDRPGTERIVLRLTVDRVVAR